MKTFEKYLSTSTVCIRWDVWCDDCGGRISMVKKPLCEVILLMPGR